MMGESKMRQAVAGYLIEKGMSVTQGQPVLHALTQPKFLRFLVEHGADPFVVDEPEKW